jgi:hypothetical protein
MNRSTPVKHQEATLVSMSSPVPRVWSASVVRIERRKRQIGRRLVRGVLMPLPHLTSWGGESKCLMSELGPLGRGPEQPEHKQRLCLPWPMASEESSRSNIPQVC